MIHRYRSHTADVVTDRLFGGNQLAVFPDAAGLGAARMQQIARELNLSETVFVFPPEQPEYTRGLRIFTPGMELPFAGHPTIGAAFVLGAIGAIPLSAEETRIVFEESVGPVPVTIRARAGRPVFAELTAARVPELGPEPPPLADLAALLTLTEQDLVDGPMRPRGASAGVPFLFIPLRDRAALGRVRLDLAVWEHAFARSWAPHIVPFTADADAGSDLRMRMFAPAMGITEDPATGGAAAALAGYLAALEPTGSSTLSWEIEQGVEMNRPSRIRVEADRREGAVTAVRVGGAAVLVAEATMVIPD